MILTVSFVLFPVIGIFVTVTLRILPRRLMPASRHQNHTTSPSASQRIRLLRRKRPPHPASNVRDDRDTPLLGRRDSADSAGDLRIRSMPEGRDELARRANHSLIHIPICSASP
jgi:hypothetical protein